MSRGRHLHQAVIISSALFGLIALTATSLQRAQAHLTIFRVRLWLLITLTLVPTLASAITVTIDAPSPASGTVDVTASTDSTRRLRRLEIRLDGTQVHSCPTTPCVYRWDTTRATDGAHTLRARRVATNGSTINSNPLTVQVQNQTQPPPLPPNAVSIWPNTATPINDTASDTASVELGVKFRADVPGDILGIRFYKGPQNLGTHTGKLWDTSGQLLASLTFTNETASGWQQALFATPVQIAAHTTYIASYHAPQGHYAGDNGGLTTEVYRAPLKALASAASGGNGVYHYGASRFPTDTWQASNYWVDVVFRPETSEPPPPPPPPPPPSDLLTLLAGPLSPMGQPPITGIGAHDQAQLSFGQYYADRWPGPSGDLVSYNFYDLAYSLYQVYHRTNDPYWLGKARQAATDWRDQANIQSLHRCIESQPFNWNNCGSVMAPRNMALMGLAVLAVDQHDAEARTLLDLYAKFIRLKGEQTWFNDPRENGYILMYLAAAVAHGWPHQALAEEMLDTILAAQLSNGAFPQGYPTGYPYPENFMQGVLMEGLQLYDRVIGDPRIVPAMQRLTAWLWSTQWLPAHNTFMYAPPESGLGTGPAYVLNGLFLPGWGYLYERTGDTTYRNQGNLIFQGLAERGVTAGELWSSKQYSQVFRASPRYLGYLTLP